MEIEYDGFCIAPDELIIKYGPTTAVIWGRIWRYTHMADGVCSAAQDKIAAGSGVSRTTIYRHLKDLEDGGYIVDLTPELKDAPHRYQVTDKIKLKIAFSTPASQVFQNETPKEKPLQIGVSNRNTKIKNTELPNGNSVAADKEPKEKPQRKPNPLWDAIVAVTKMDPAIKAHAERVGRVVKQIKASDRNYEPAVIAGLFGEGKGNWWYNVRQAGIVEKQRPTPESILRDIGIAYDWYTEKKARQAAAPVEQSAVLSQIYQNSQL